jgi:glyoxylase-like metal-dependent hydrolase (beta-lactamase superfamily II)
MTTSSPSVHRVSRLGFVNAYLIPEDDGLTLVDTMIPGSAKAILAAAQGLGAPIVRIALTHAHGDHIGSLDALAAQLPDAEVLITARDAKLLAKDKSLEPGEPQDKLRGGYPGAKTRPTRTIAAGDHVGSLEVVAAPGHTPGQVAFLDRRDGTLYCADAYSTLGGVATSAKPNPRFPLPAMATWSRAIALDSARVLRALDPARLAPGHGKVVESPAAAMDAAIAKAA